MSLYIRILICCSYCGCSTETIAEINNTGTILEVIKPYKWDFEPNGNKHRCKDCADFEGEIDTLVQINEKYIMEE
jgi:hypothetical protein